MDYPAAIAALRARGRFGISLGTERVERLLDELGNPQRSLHGALVAGTNGKGSVVAMTRSVLAAAGLRVGTMPKPHLVSYRERIAIDGRPLGRERFAAAIDAVMPAIARVERALGPPTEFEALTAAAVAELSTAAIDLALVEVGMGGRLDATNVLDLGVAAITNVQHDHERHLGRTLGAIGGEKAAIIKPGDHAVTGATGRGLQPILSRCAALGVPLRRAGARQAYRATLLGSGWDGLVLDLTTPAGMLAGLRLGLLGRHQAANAAVAIALLDALADDAAHRGRPLRVDEAAVRAGMAAARWPGRLEPIDGGEHIGRVVLDGAHNPAGARALTVALRDLGVRDMPFVFGATRGKRVAAMLRALLPLDPQPIFTAVEGAGGIPPGELLRAWKRISGGWGGDAISDPRAALEAAALRRRADEPVVVAGSLYLVGAIRGMLTGEGDEG